MDTNEVPNDESMTISDEDRLLDGKDTSARTNPAEVTKQKQTKISRNKAMDSNRSRSNSLGDVSLLRQSTLQCHFGQPHSGANTNSTLKGKPNETLCTNSKSTVTSSETLVFGKLPDGAGNTSTSSDISNATVNVHANSTTLNQNWTAGNHTANTANERPATLNDIKSAMESNAAIMSMLPPTQIHPLRPPLQASSTPNKDGGASAKKRRRGGKKYRAMMEKRAQRESQGQNHTDAGKNEQQKQNASTPTNAGKKSTQPNAITNKYQQGLQGQNSGKRGRATGGTPPEATHKNKRANTNTHTAATATVTAADVVVDANLVVAVYDSPAPGIILPMDKVKYRLLYESINNILFSDIETCNVIPTFNENKHVRGVMKVQCSTPAARAWLVSAIQRTTTLWTNMKLNVVDFNKLPQQIRVLGLFPNCKLDAKRIRSMLNAMNPHVSADSWSILSSKTTDKGAHVAFGINELQLAMLRASRFKLFFGAGSALFKDISKKNANQQHENPIESDMDIQSTEASDDEDNITIIVNNGQKGQQQSMASSSNAQNTSGAMSGTVLGALPITMEQNTATQNTRNANGVPNPITEMETGTPTNHGAT